MRGKALHGCKKEPRIRAGGVQEGEVGGGGRGGGGGGGWGGGALRKEAHWRRDAVRKQRFYRKVS